MKICIFVRLVFRTCHRSCLLIIKTLTKNLVELNNLNKSYFSVSLWYLKPLYEELQAYFAVNKGKEWNLFHVSF